MKTNSPDAAQPAGTELGPPPRAVRMTTQGHVVRGAMTALLVAVPACFMVYGKHERARLDRLNAQGRQTSGTVVGMSHHKSTYTLRYAYKVNGKSYRSGADVRSRDYDATYLGAMVTVTYLPADPQVSQYGKVGPEDGADSERQKLIMGVIFAAGLLIGLGAIERQIARDRRLCKHGIAIEGAVVEQIAGKYAKTRYVYMPADGQARYNTAQATFAIAKLGVGQTFTVLYDPADPDISKPHVGITMAKIVNAE